MDTTDTKVLAVPAGDIQKLAADVERLASCLEDAQARGVGLAYVAHHLAGIDLVRANARAVAATASKVASDTGAGLVAVDDGLGNDWFGDQDRAKSLATDTTT